jgi:hypothetical protein
MSSVIPTILHVGTTKTGSSSLQYELTRNSVIPSLSDPKLQFEYLMVRNGMCLRGSAMLDFAKNFAAYYAFSANLPELLEQSLSDFERMKSVLTEMRALSVAPILSYEEWFKASREHVHRFTDLLDTQLHVVVYLRPPVKWYNSWYGERGLPQNSCLDTFLSREFTQPQWSECIKNWRSAPNVTKVDVRLMGESVLEDFCEVVGCRPIVESARQNVSLPAELVRLLSRAPQHFLCASQIKLAWWRWMAAADPQGELRKNLAPYPFHLNKRQVEAIIAQTQNSSLALLEMCDPEIRARIENDPFWWSVDAYERQWRSVSISALSKMYGEINPSWVIKEQDQLLYNTFAALIAADTAWREISVELLHARLRLSDLEELLGSIQK